MLRCESDGKSSRSCGLTAHQGLLFWRFFFKVWAQIIERGQVVKLFMSLLVLSCYAVIQSIVTFGLKSKTVILPTLVLLCPEH